VWRYLSFQFLHADFWHIALNMLGLYFLGTPLEQRWGRRRFLAFYLSCGAFAGVAYVVVMLATMGQAAWSVPLLGASGGVYGIILAAAVLFPHFRLIFLFFPVPIRLAALIIFGGMLFTVFAGLAGRGISPAFWSQVAHLGGTAVAAVWLWVVPRASGAISDGRQRIRWGTWQRRIEHQREEQMELDRILDKIHEQGITSLTRREKKILHDATRRQREQERELHRL
jgi:membrane associated rhomboid family serine protease